MWAAGWTCILTKSGTGIGYTWKKDGNALTDSGRPVADTEKSKIVYDQ